MNVFATARYFLCSGWASSSLTVSSGRPKSALAFSQWTSPSRTTLMYAPPSNAAMKEPRQRSRSEEDPSVLQSLMRISYAVFCLKITNAYNVCPFDSIYYACYYPLNVCETIDDLRRTQRLNTLSG